MPNEGHTGAAAPSELSVLIFRTAGVKMAVDSREVDEIIDTWQADRDQVTFESLGEMLGMAGSAASSCTKVLLVKGEEGNVGFGIDELCEITTLKMESLRHIPELLTCYEGPRRFRGIMAKGAEVVLLVDLHSLKGLKACEEETSA